MWIDCAVSEERDVLQKIERKNIQMNLNTFISLAMRAPYTMRIICCPLAPSENIFLGINLCILFNIMTGFIRNILIVTAGNESFIFTITVKIAMSFHLIQLHRCKSYGNSVTFFIEIGTILSF